MLNDISFDVIVNNTGELVKAVTNIFDMDYKYKLEEKARQDEEKRKAKKRAISEKQSENKKAIANSDNKEPKKYSVSSEVKVSKSIKPKKKLCSMREGGESPIVKYNKKLIADEKFDE